jgi:hypothetical protein
MGEGVQHRMFGFGLGLVAFGVWIYSIMDILTTHPSDVRLLPKLVWLLGVVVFFPLAVAWLLCGRPRRAYSDDGYGYAAGERPVRRPGWDAGRADAVGNDHPSVGRSRMRRPAARPFAPDDDPEFLRELSERIRRGRPDDPAT